MKHREAVAAAPPRRYLGQRYWARPLPGFGDPRARLLLVGLAPAAHGGNRTGRMFTGDRSGDWLFDRLLTQVRVVVGLGRIGWQAYLRGRLALGAPRERPAPKFGHGAVTRFADGMILIATYHPSQQNTFTGKLTRPMLRGIFETARDLLDKERR